MGTCKHKEGTPLVDNSLEFSSPAMAAKSQKVVTFSFDATAQNGYIEEPLDLQNSFDVLVSDSEELAGEAWFKVLDDTLANIEVVNARKTISDHPIEVIGLMPDTSKKGSVPAETMCSPFVSHDTEQFEESKVGRMSFPNSISPSVSIVTSNKVVDPVTLLHWANTPVLTHLAMPSCSVSSYLMPQPITTSYTRLTSDKLPSSQILGPASKPSHHSVATRKSVQILSEFGGDEVAEEDNNEAFTSVFEQHYPSLSESTKTERKKKKQLNKVKPNGFNSAEIRTRAQKSKSTTALADTK